jgi:circadian clock protein KaiB
MPQKKAEDATERYERYLKETEKGPFVLRLYVTGATPASTRAITNLKTLCEKHLKGRVDLEVIDIFQRPELAQGEQIIATPTLVKELPLPLRRFIGDLDGLEGKLLGLDVKPLPEAPEG